MRCFSAHEYVVSEAKMTKILPICLQTSGFPNQSPEYAFECCREQLGRYDIFLSFSYPGVDLVAYFVLWTVIELLLYIFFKRSMYTCS